MSYKKHYPKGYHAATPFVKDGPLAGVLVDGKRLTTIMVRAYDRRSRWQYHVARRRLTVPRPLTVAEKTLRRLRYYANELLNQLTPFRHIRPTGHHALRSLLQDDDTRPLLVAQVNALRSTVASLRPLYVEHQTQIDHLRREWDSASAERRQQILQVHLAQDIQDQLIGLLLLADEALTDATRLESMAPTAFAGHCQEWVYRHPFPAPGTLVPTQPTHA